MTYVIDESLSDEQFTPTDLVDDVFGVNRRYESITVHHWGSFGQTHDGVNSFFVNGNPNTSAHFVASDGRINCLVSPANAAWAAGNAYGNATSIHIEARPEATDGDYRTVAWLVSWLRDHYGANLPLKAHREWSATACPGKWDLARVDAEARAWSTDTPVSAPAPVVVPQSAPAPAPAPQALGNNQVSVDPGDTLSGIAAQFGVDLGALIAENGITEPDKIFPGMILNLPVWTPPAHVPVRPPYCYVDAGDTLGGIAAQFGVSLAHVIAVNPGINPDRIFPGQRIEL